MIIDILILHNLTLGHHNSRNISSAWPASTFGLFLCADLVRDLHMDGEKIYYLLGPDRKTHPSPTKGALGGHRKRRIYGRLNCPTALRALAKGGYKANRVFFADEETAILAGYRPCARCMPERYKLLKWK